MSGFTEYDYEACSVCAYLVAYGEYNDGENTAEDKWLAWESREFSAQHASVGDPMGYLHNSCDLCGDWTIDEFYNITVLIPKGA